MPQQSDESALIADIINKYRNIDGPCLPIFHGLQEHFGYVPAAAIPMVADSLNLSRAEVHGIVTFYKDFKSEPQGRHHVKLCRAESCQAVGCDSLIDVARKQLGIDFDQTTADGLVTLEPVFCLGNCALSPAAMIDDKVYGRLDQTRFQSLLNGLRDAGAAS